ncbi:DNA primase [Cellvibrio sp. QJXJ]|uniref:DNA primase n=1 Tax=Cellvibrio sp. QJXJ TaxID=2964606 RepID=UPI0021C354AD|nr:DNA primase [Cellvibrio sp. QJXJ]UUA75181.1 DNA primase [Cellvibrio sp. QJXJ]
MQYSPDLLQKIADSLDIVDVIDSHVSLKKSGKNYSACCPFHEENTPSFSVNAEDQLYYCFGCGAGGNVFNFYEGFCKVSFPESVRAMAKLANIELPKEEMSLEQRKEIGDRARALDVLEQANQIYRAELPTNQEVLTLLSKRGLNRDMVDKFSLGAAKNEWRHVIELLGGMKNLNSLVDSGLAVFEKKTDTTKGKFYDRYRNAPVFPIRDTKGRVVSFAIRPLQPISGDGNKGSKYINGPETSVFSKSKFAYGLYESLQVNSNPDRLIVVEGYMDVISHHQFGITNTVSSMGTAVNEQKIKSLYRHTDHLTFCFDGDDAGIEASKRALNAVLPFLDDQNSASFVTLPAGEDPDSYIRKIGAEAYSIYLTRNDVPASEYLFQIARNGNSDLSSAESRGQAFANAKLLMDQMPPSTMKAIMLSRLQDITGIKPTEYLPYSIQLAEGACNGVDLGSLEAEVRELIASRLGAKVADVKVQWSMPEIGPKQIPFSPVLNVGDAQQELKIRMREVGRVLSLETPVARGLTLAQVLNTARSNINDASLMAKGLIAGYMRDSDAFDTECRLAVSHLEFIKNQLAAMNSGLNQTTKDHVIQWAQNVGNKAFVVNSIRDYVDSNTAANLDRSVQSMIKIAGTIEKNLKMDEIPQMNEEKVMGRSI